MAGSEFINPYNFVRVELNPERCERLPVRNTHEQFHPGCFSGRINCTLQVITPLFVPDPTKTTESANDQPKEMRFNRGVDGKPLIQSTSLKGMVRSVLETVSNSCFGVFDDERLDFRTTNVSKYLKPAIITELNHEQEKAKIVVLEKNEMAWLPASRTWDFRNKLHLPDREERFVFAKIGNVPERVSGKRRVPAHGRVTENLQESADTLTPCLGGEQTFEVLVKHTGLPLDPDGQTRSNKHDERVFFSKASPLDLKSHIKDAAPIEIPYNRILELESILDRQYTRFNNLEKAATPNYANEEMRKRLNRRSFEGPQDIRLKVNDLVYYYPPGESLGLVLIPRMRYDRRIGKLLPTYLHPCGNIQNLCPACRLFGFASAGDQTGFRGKVSFSQGRYETPTENGESPFKFKILKVLGSPQPTSTNFYLINEDYKNNPTVTVACGGYDRPGSILRGRKFYWQQGDADAPLSESKYAVDNGNRFNSKVELLMPGSANQKRWFRFSIDFENLTEEELALLVWSLELEEGMHHRLGMGKPLGLGTVKITIDTAPDKTYALDHESIVEYYSNIECDQEALKQRNSITADRITSLKEMVKAKYGDTMNYADLCRIMRFHGRDFADRVKYPSARKEGVAGGFQWFAGNKDQPLRTIDEICGPSALKQEGWED